MPTLSILGQGISILAFLLAGSARPRTQTRLAVSELPAAESDESESCEKIPVERLPDSSALSGVPLRILLSERSGPGGLLRDTLMVRPNLRD